MNAAKEEGGRSESPGQTKVDRFNDTSCGRSRGLVFVHSKGTGSNAMAPQLSLKTRTAEDEGDDTKRKSISRISNKTTHSADVWERGMSHSGTTKQLDTSDTTTRKKISEKETNAVRRCINVNHNIGTPEKKSNRHLRALARQTRTSRNKTFDCGRGGSRAGPRNRVTFNPHVRMISQDECCWNSIDTDNLWYTVEELESIGQSFITALPALRKKQDVQQEESNLTEKKTRIHRDEALPNDEHESNNDISYVRKNMDTVNDDRNGFQGEAYAFSTSTRMLCRDDCSEECRLLFLFAQDNDTKIRQVVSAVLIEQERQRSHSVHDPMEISRVSRIRSSSGNHAGLSPLQLVAICSLLLLLDI